MGCHGCGCMPRCKGMKLVTLGLIILLNEYILGFNWWYLFAALFIVKGAMLVVFDGCLCRKMMKFKEEECCGSCCSQEEKTVEPKSVKKKKGK